MVQDGDLQFDVELIRRQLNHVLASNVFAAAKRSRMFLRYIVERTLVGAPPKEFEIAAEVLGRGADYDPETDATVRVEASRLRHRLREYYDTTGRNDPVFIQIPKGGYRAVFGSPEKIEIASSTTSAPFTIGALAPTDSIPRRNWWRNVAMKRKWRIGSAALIVVVLLTAARWMARQKKQPAAPIHSLAVLPLQNLSGDPREEYFVDGMTDALITELAHLPNLRVVSRTSAMQEKGNRRPLRQIAGALGVDAVIEGSMVRSKERVRITAQLIDTRDDRHLWAQTYEERISDIVTLQDKVVRDIAVQTQTTLAPAVSEMRSRRAVRPDAYDAYLRGLYFLNQRMLDKSVVYFREAVAADSSYGDALAGLSEALATQAVANPSLTANIEAEALAAAKRSIALNPQSGDAYSALALVEMTCHKDWMAAGLHLEKSLALSPNNPLTELHYAIYLDAMGRPEEAVSQMRRAVVLDPRSFLMNRHLGATLYFARQYEEAIRYLERAEEMEPASAGFVDEWSTRSYEMAHRLDEAEQADLRQMSGSFPEAGLALLRRAYGQGDWMAYQKARIDLVGKHPGSACDQYDVGISYLRLGDADRALSRLARGAEGGCFWADMLRVDPMVDGLRGDPHFSALLRIAGLEASGNRQVMTSKEGR